MGSKLETLISGSDRKRKDVPPKYTQKLKKYSREKSENCHFTPWILCNIDYLICNSSLYSSPNYLVLYVQHAILACDHVWNFCRDVHQPPQSGYMPHASHLHESPCSLAHKFREVDSTSHYNPCDHFHTLLLDFGRSQKSRKSLVPRFQLLFWCWRTL